jgi:hypothetical protein
MNRIATLGTYCFFDKKPAIRVDIEKPVHVIPELFIANRHALSPYIRPHF